MHVLTKYLFLVSLFLLPGSSFSQLDLINTSLTDPHKNILYLGIENVIQIIGLDHDDSLRIESSSSKVFRSDWRGEHYRIVMPVDRSLDTLLVYGNNVLLLRKVFEVHRLSDPIAQLGNITRSSATVSEILQDPTLSVVIPDCFYDHTFRVLGFEVYVIQAFDTMQITRTYARGTIDTLYREDLDTGELTMDTLKRTEFETFFRTKNNTLVDYQIDRIKLMRVGDRLLIDNIKAGCADCSLRKLNPLIITIKL